MERRSKRQHKPAIGKKSHLQLQFENAIESPGGMGKVIKLLNNASDEDIATLNELKWTPLVGIIFRLGKNTTSKGNSSSDGRRLLSLIRLVHQRGLSLNSAAIFGDHLHRPLVVSAYYGFADAVKIMIELGALPDFGDGEGRTVWFAAMENPVASGKRHRLRDCDKQTVQILIDMGVVTPSLKVWRSCQKGTICYMNGDSSRGSPLLRAISTQNTSTISLLQRLGCHITDRDYLELHRRGKVGGRKKNVFKSRMWTSDNDWTFPPTYKVATAVLQNLGLPREIYNLVKTFCGRDWFYTSRQLGMEERRKENSIMVMYTDYRHPLLGPSLFEAFGASKELSWLNKGSEETEANEQEGKSMGLKVNRSYPEAPRIKKRRKSRGARHGGQGYSLY